jgi:AcrR family transcriptional regulator
MHRAAPQRPAQLASARSSVAASPQPTGRLTLAQRRRQLIEVARRVFAERGFRGATTRRIAAVAGVTEALIFQHFPDKDALYTAILDEQATEERSDAWLSELESGFASMKDGEVVRRLYTGLITQYDRDPDLLRLMMFSALEEHPLSRHLQDTATRLYRLLEAFITAGQRAGRFKSGSPAFLARATLALPVYYSLQRHLFRTPWPRVETAEMIESGVAFTLAALSRPRRVAIHAVHTSGSVEVRS